MKINKETGGLELKDIHTTKDIKQYIEGCLNDFENGISEKEETITLLYELVNHFYNAKTEQ